ncbi:uncharacterized protein ASCRUDRAFT_137327 [Ascoidea rubescens DSM 1968]|uniref:Uncharacterized protein n=1 Tax=Ascoidea rubescens DSM 1968 TaxID=1344418 RepID=A0A1D2VM56_9ASCO|nr:hypothetical protein ASCRUDRAFT_137327 [Ascoidea rubescens DSM 1968]ODV62689.1 hypothetical protein ASCRUDRAFT_137327 [Ascoidea rubescens DSM 1968]
MSKFKSLIKYSAFVIGVPLSVYSYNLNSKYDNFPIYILPNDMLIQSVISDYKKKKSLSDKYIAYCDTFISEEINLSSNLIDLFKNEKTLNDHILLKFFNTNLFKAEVSLIGNSKNLKKPIDLANTPPRSNIVYNDPYNETENNIANILKLIKSSSNSNLLQWEIYPPSLVSFFEKIAKYGYPWRLMNGGYHEVYIHFIPNKNTNNENGKFKIYFTCAHEYNKFNHDGKILPKFTMWLHRFYAKLLLDQAVRDIKNEFTSFDVSTKNFKNLNLPNNNNSTDNINNNL